MRTPSPAERRKERAFINTNLADSCVVVCLMIAAFTSGSLTMLSEAVRGFLLLTIDYFSIWVMVSLHRGRMQRYEFGTAKLEKMVWVIVGFGLIVGAFGIGRSIMLAVLSTDPPASPLGLAFAAVVNAVNVTINVTGLIAMLSAAGDRESGVFGAQLRARLSSTTSAIFLQITLTLGALSKDAQLALALDAIGAILVVGIMMTAGVRMIRNGLPTLLDARATDDRLQSIEAAVASTLAPDQLIAIKTRQSGDMTFAEVHVKDATFTTITELRAGERAIQNALSDLGNLIRLTVVTADKD